MYENILRKVDITGKRIVKLEKRFSDEKVLMLVSDNGKQFVGTYLDTELIDMVIESLTEYRYNVNF